MLKDLYFKKLPRIEAVLCPSYMKLTPIDEVSDGVLVRSSEFRSYNVEDNNKQFSFRDFEIGNIIAVGATNMLKPVSMANHDVAGVAQAFDDLNNKLDGTTSEN